MRHRVAGRRLGRDSEHRLAMRRNMVASLFEHETISTTIEKAKEVKPFAEKLITLAKQGTLAARRRAISLLCDRRIVSQEEGVEVEHDTVIRKLFSEIGPRYLDRPGGYTRIIRLPLRRLGDNGKVVLLQLVGKDETSKKSTPKKSRRKKAKIDEPVMAEEVVEAEQVEAPVETETDDTQSQDHAEQK
ncbi:50S ribosomal protein L17 [Planctomycetota bacterium]